MKNKKIFPKHLLLLLYWPVYISVFFLTEILITSDLTVIECGLDRVIPFCEFFIIPYVMWYLYLVWIHLYTLIKDTKTFKKLMYFIIISFSLACVIFTVFPSQQLLRPESFPRDNVFTDAVEFLYKIDTNTNVFPSLHVVGSLAVLFSSWNVKGLNTVFWRIANTIFATLISFSTVFLKQHSVLDILSALVLCVVVYPIAFILPDKLVNRKTHRGKKTVEKAELSI